jgi:hypothetical protein
LVVWVFSEARTVLRAVVTYLHLTVGVLRSVVITVFGTSQGAFIVVPKTGEYCVVF